MTTILKEKEYTYFKFIIITKEKLGSHQCLKLKYVAFEIMKTL